MTEGIKALYPDLKPLDIRLLEGVGNTPALALAMRGWLECHDKGYGDGQLNVWAGIKAFLAYAQNGQEMLPVGVLTWDWTPELKRVFVYQAYVEPEFRGRGVYSGLWAAMVAHAVEKLPGCAKVELGTHMRNSAMRAVCAKQGLIEEAVFLCFNLGGQ